MKNLFIALLVTVSGMTASARSLEFVPTIASVEGYQEGLIRVSLLEDGRIYSTNNKGVYKMSQLSPSATQVLVNLVRSLSNVSIKEDYRQVVCKMMVLPSLSDLKISGYNVEAGRFSGEQALVLTQQSCATAHVVYPIDAHALNAAKQLRAHLVLLGLNTLQ